MNKKVNSQKYLNLAFILFHGTIFSYFNYLFTCLNCCVYFSPLKLPMLKTKKSNRISLSLSTAKLSY